MPEPLSSTMVATPLGEAIATALEIAARGGDDRTQSVREILDVLTALRPGAKAALMTDDETINASNSRARRSITPFAGMRALQRPLPHVSRATLWFALPSDDEGNWDTLLDQLAAILSLAWRSGRDGPRSEARTTLAQLQKLAGLGQSAAQIVHELNNPLTAIVAYSDYLATRYHAGATMTDADVDRLMRIQEAATRIQRFCRDLTEYSRPSSALMAPVDVHDVIDRALAFCMHGLRSADIAVERLYRDVPMIRGVEASLVQVFVNLITNAWHAMDPDGGTLSLRTHLEDDEVIIEVADEGHGIAEPDLERVFDSYFTTKPKGRGVGLGLSIVRQIVHDHGGHVQAERRDPRGTIFYIALPRGS